MKPDAELVQLAARNARACCGRLRLPLRGRLWQGAAGEMAGYGTGSSMDFQDHRPYFPGDDPRHINWQAYARTEQYTMKLYREETRPTVNVFFDVTPSMFLTQAKALRSLELFLFAVENARRTGAVVDVRLLDGGIAHPIPAESVQTHQWLDHWPEPGPDFLPPPSQVPVRQGSLRIWISDLLFPGDPSPWMRCLTARSGTAIILAPFAREESSPGWSGPCDFVEVESARRQSRNVDKSTLQRYLAAYSAHFQTWKDQARRFHLPFACVPSSGSLEDALSFEALAARAVEPTA